MVQRSCGLAFNVLLLGSCIILRLPLSLLVEPLLRSIAYDYFIFGLPLFRRNEIGGCGRGAGELELVCPSPQSQSVPRGNHNRCHVATIRYIRRCTVGLFWLFSANTLLDKNPVKVGSFGMTPHSHVNRRREIWTKCPVVLRQIHVGVQ